MELELSGPLLTRKNRFRFARDTGFAEVESGPGPGTAPLPYAFGSRPCHCRDEYNTINDSASLVFSGRNCQE